MAVLSTTTTAISNENGHKMKENESNTGRLTQQSLSFAVFDVYLTILSIIVVLIQFFTGLFLVIEYSEIGFSSGAWVTSIFIIMPSIVVEGISLRWLIADNSATKSHWILHCSFLGVLHRYFSLLILGLNAKKSNEPSYYQKVISAQCDLSLLLIFGAFLESSPQLVFQLFTLVTRQDLTFSAGIFSAVSFTAIMVALVAYSRTQRRARSDKLLLHWLGLVLQFLWRVGMLAARICSLVLLLYCFQSWFLLFISVHWLSMFLWIIYQETNLCDNQWEERCFNAIAAVIYCFCFLNLKEGKSRWKILCFYSLTVLENLTCLTVYLMWFSERTPRLGIIAFIVVVGGTILGFTIMALYYRFFHAAGPLKWCGTSSTIMQPSVPQPVRTLKRLCPPTFPQYGAGTNNDSPISGSHITSSDSKLTLSDSKLMLSDSVVIVEESDMEEINTLQGWLKEAVAEEQIKQRLSDLDEAASSVLSAHDYENMAAVNIARAGGLRSWRGYCDIETWLHDDSVVRDTTTTSTTTSTSQDYLDSIADDYVECKLSSDPVGLFAPSSLDTILEEAESSCSERSPSRGRSTCTLVATIDQIRITTPVQEERSSRVRRKFSLIRERFEGRRESVEAPVPPPWCPTPYREGSSSPRRLSVKEMRAFFLKQVLTPPKLYSLRRKVIAP